MSAIAATVHKKRRRLHACARDAGLSAEERHALQLTITGHESTLDMNLDELTKTGNYFAALARHRRVGEGGPPPSPNDQLNDTPTTRKLRALWISAYHLGLLRDNSDGALVVFVKNFLKIDSARWADYEIRNVIERMKDWMAKPYPDGGGVVWDRKGDPRVQIIAAQMRIIRSYGEPQSWPPNTVEAAAGTAQNPESNQVINKLGRMIRDRKSREI